LGGIALLLFVFLPELLSKKKSEQSTADEATIDEKDKL
jgi:competence protein ComGC